MHAASLSHAIVISILVSSASGAAHSKVHTVNYADTPIWTVGIGVSYADMSINLGDTMEFASYSSHDVVLVDGTPPSKGTAWDLCGATGITPGNMTSIWAVTDYTHDSVTKKHWTPPTCGTFYIACSISAHCQYGQRLVLTVKNKDGGACASPCSKAACATADSKVTKTAGVIHSVKPKPDSGYWGQGPYGMLSVNVGDTVLFRTGAGFHDVATVPTSTAFQNCDMTGMTQVANWDYQVMDKSTAACQSSDKCCPGSTCGKTGYYVTYTWTAAAAGDTYFVCSIGGGNHCKTGQKIQVRVSEPTTAGPTAAPAASATVNALPCMMHMLLAICSIAIYAA